MTKQERTWILEDLKQEFLLLIAESKFEEADRKYQQYKLVKEVKVDELSECSS